MALSELINEALLVSKRGSKKKIAQALAKQLETDPFSELKPMLENVAPGTGRMEAAEPLSDFRVPQRRPSSYKTGDEMKNLLINMEVVRQDPKLVSKMASYVDEQPWATPEIKKMNDWEKLQAYRDFQSENIESLWHLMPKDTRERAGRWYEGANQIADKRASEVGIPKQAAAGTYAALSPQMDWFKNVYLGDSVLRTLHNDPKITSDMLAKAASMKAFREPMLHTGVVPVQRLRAHLGKSISQIDDPLEQAFAVRLWDETHGERKYSRIAPEGDYLDYERNLNGSPSKPGWGSFREIEKSIRAAKSGGDMSQIYDALGSSHKVPDFYNNIIAPHEGAKFGDITADTHQGAAGHMMPMSGSTPEIDRMLSGPPKSAPLGVAGMYPITADATRLAAHRLGVPTFRAQSVPWEAIRALFPDTWKTPENFEKIRGVWQMVGEKKLTREKARKVIIEMAHPGGFRPPKWLLLALMGMGLGKAEKEMNNA